MDCTFIAVSRRYNGRSLWEKEFAGVVKLGGNWRDLCVFMSYRVCAVEIIWIFFLGVSSVKEVALTAQSVLGLSLQKTCFTSIYCCKGTIKCFLNTYIATVQMGSWKFLMCTSSNPEDNWRLTNVSHQSPGGPLTRLVWCMNGRRLRKTWRIGAECEWIGTGRE